MFDFSENGKSSAAEFGRRVQENQRQLPRSLQSSPEHPAASQGALPPTDSAVINYAGNAAAAAVEAVAEIPAADGTIAIKADIANLDRLSSSLPKTV